MVRLLARYAPLAVIALTMSSIAPCATVYTAVLNGANESPTNNSPATGNITVTLDGNMLMVNEMFSGLTAPGSAAHIHCCGPVGVNEVVAVPFSGFPSTSSGSYVMTFDLSLLSTYNAAFVSAVGGTVSSAESAFITGLNSGQTYANIHNSNFPGGEIRGQLGAVPEPSSFALLFGLLPVAALVVRRRSTLSVRR